MPADADVTLLHVAPGDVEALLRRAPRFGHHRRPPPGPAPRQIAAEAAEALLADAAERLGRPARTESRRGRVEHEVVAALEGADLLVLARDGERRRHQEPAPVDPLRGQPRHLQGAARVRASPMPDGLAGQDLFITGASRGIGLAIGLRAARDGANVAIAAKTAEPNPKLPGTIFTAAKEIEAAGGKALPLVVRRPRRGRRSPAAVAKTVETFGGIDILVNNASAISLTGTEQTEMKRYDLMHQINTRGTFLCSKLCIPHLKKAANPHVLNLSPPLNMETRWFAPHVAYTMAKFGMSMCVLGMAGEC